MFDKTSLEVLDLNLNDKTILKILRKKILTVAIYVANESPLAGANNRKWPNNDKHKLYIELKEVL